MRSSRILLILALATASFVLLPRTAAAAPRNDDIEGASVMPGLPFNDQVNTSDATVADNDPATDCFGPLATVWYAFTPERTMHVQLDTIRSDFNTTLAVFSGSPGALTAVICNDDGVDVAPASRVVFTATAGTQYFVMAGTCCGGDPGQIGPGGNLFLSAAEMVVPPSNDDIEAAVVIPGLPFNDQVNTSEATVGDDDPATECSGPLATVWYAFTPERTMHVQLDTIRSDFNTTLAVFSGSPGALTAVTCNDDGVHVAPASRVVFTATAGTRYFVMAGTCCGGHPGQIGPGGSLFLNAAEAAEAPLTITVTVDSGTVSDSGRAIVAGTVSCRRPASSPRLFVGLVQRFARFEARGHTPHELPACGPTPLQWSVEVFSSTGVTFGPGPAEAGVQARACDDLICTSTEVGKQLRLRPKRG